MEQVIKMNEEVKGELMEIRKLQSTVERHADRVETMFTEMQKKTAEFVRFNDTVKDLDKSFKQISSEFDSIKVKITDFSTKKETENLIAKFDDFEKYVGSIVSLIGTKFDKLEHGLMNDLNKRYTDMEKLVVGFKVLAAKVPDLDVYFHLLEAQAKGQEKQAEAPRLKTPGVDDENMKVEKKESLVSKMTDAVSDAAETLKGKMKK